MIWPKGSGRKVPEVSVSDILTPDSRRAEGPWDSAEVADRLVRVDFGSLKVVPRQGMDLQLAGDGSRYLALLLVYEGSALELRPLAATKAGGDWQDVRAHLRSEIEARGSETTEREGPFGPELLAQFPAPNDERTDLVQPARFIGVEGRRWLLQATILGPEGMKTNDTGGLMDVLRDVVVERGSEPRLVGELLPITNPGDSAGPADVQ